jgi:hypothetical protein
MPMEAKSQPFIMLVHHPEVVDPCSIEHSMDEMVCNSLGDQVRLYVL